MVGTSGFSWAVVGRFLKQVTAGLLEPSSEGVLLGFRTAAPSPTQPRKLEGKRGLLTPTCFLTHLGGGFPPRLPEALNMGRRWEMPGNVPHKGLSYRA